MFGISNNVKSRVVRTCTPELFRKAVDSPLVARVCAEIEDALEAVRRGGMSRTEFDTLKAERKKMLPVITPHATFRNGRRLNADAVPSGLSMYDVDHIDTPRGYYEDHVRGREKELGVVLAHVTPSLEGLRLVFIIDNGEWTMDNGRADGSANGNATKPDCSLSEAQRWMSEQLGDACYDGAVKDLARCSFLVPGDYILYLDEEGLFAGCGVTEKGESETGKPETEAGKMEAGDVQSEKEQNDERKKSENHDVASAPKSGAVVETVVETVAGAMPGAVDISTPVTTAAPCAEPTFKGVPYSKIIAQWLTLTGGEPQQGERNTRLHRMASHLRYITDNDEALLLGIMPRYGLTGDEMKGLIHSACTSKFCSTPREMRQAVRMAQASEVRGGHDLSGGEDGARTGSPLGDDGELPPPLPKKLPGLIKLLLSRTPEVYQPAVAHAVFPALGAHLHQVRFRYIDNVPHEATLMNVLMAGTGAGKDCISEPINRIMTDIRRRDEENLRREREWKNEVNSKGANKDKRQRPEGLVIQEIDADMTNPAFVMRTAEADRHFLYTKMNEIDQFDALRGGGRGGQQFQIMCLAFDPGNRYGQTRVGTMSVTEKVTIRFNWNAATTILKGKRYFSRVLTDGPVSRINFCTIPEREIGAEMPVYGEYDAAFDEELRPSVENLCKAVGEVDCPEAYRLAKKLKEECAEHARLSQSRVYENLSFRANVIAYLKACVLYVAAGCRWDKVMEDFIRWSLEYDLWCKMEFFGADIEEANRLGGTGEKHTPGRQNLLELLPDEFTLQDAVRVRQSQGMDAGRADTMLRNWKSRGYIESVSTVSIVSNINGGTDSKYRKLKYKNGGMTHHS